MSKVSFDTGTLASEKTGTTVLPGPQQSTHPSFWSSLGKVLTSERTAIPSSSAVSNERSNSRGRELASTGRGGAGNIVRDSTSVDRTLNGDERGRNVEPKVDSITHAGRGGQGNVRSPSRDPIKEADERAYEQEIIRKSREAREGAATYGRGGGGNVSRSRSRDPATIITQDRSRSREPGYGSGRGGAGNISETPRHSELESLDEDERRIYEVKHQQQHAHDIGSHGRGGQGNIGAEAPAQYLSTREAQTSGIGSSGRGGSGNIV